jgi:hypothetical protein
MHVGCATVPLLLREGAGGDCCLPGWDMPVHGGPELHAAQPCSFVCVCYRGPFIARGDTQAGCWRAAPAHSIARKAGGGGS